jgi:hypothetical protein
VVGDLAVQGGHFTSTTPPVAGTGNSRKGTRAKTVLTDVGPVEVTVPRDRDGSFEPKIVAKRQKRLTGGELDGCRPARGGRMPWLTSSGMTTRLGPIPLRCRNADAVPGPPLNRNRTCRKPGT